MPWNTTALLEQRLKFVTLASTDRYTMSELCLEFGISRKSGCKWLERYAVGSAAALADASRAPHSVPLRTSEAIERLVEEMAARIAAQPEKMRQRKALCEHPFGTLKRGWGFNHFLLKGLAKVNAEWSLMTLAYNLRRALNIVGVAKLIATVQE